MCSFERIDMRVVLRWFQRALILRNQVTAGFQTRLVRPSCAHRKGGASGPMEPDEKCPQLYKRVGAWNLTMASCEDRHVSGSSSLYGWSSPLLPGRTHGLTCRTP